MRLTIIYGDTVIFKNYHTFSLATLLELYGKFLSEFYRIHIILVLKDRPSHDHCLSV